MDRINPCFGWFPLRQVGRVDLDSKGLRSRLAKQSHPPSPVFLSRFEVQPCAAGDCTSAGTGIGFEYAPLFRFIYDISTRSRLTRVGLTLT